MQDNRNNLICHTWESDIVENLTPLKTFEWHLANIFLTIVLTYRDTHIHFCDLYQLTIILIMKGQSKHFENLTSIWPTRWPLHGKGDSLENMSKEFYRPVMILTTLRNYKKLWMDIDILLSTKLRPVEDLVYWVLLYGS